MRFLIVIPAYNEDRFVFDCLQSLHEQTYQNFCCVVVNDASIDKTYNIVIEFISDKVNFSVVNKKSDTSYHEPGKKIVETFYYGLETQEISQFDIICKYDADLIFPNNYLKEIKHIYEKEHNVGMIGGHIYIPKGNIWEYEKVARRDHIRGALKSYRLQCFKDINGIRKTIGWDNIDEYVAKMYGWKIITLPHLRVNQIRETSAKYKKTKAEKLGKFFYHLGLNIPLTFISIGKASLQNKSLKLGIVALVSYLKLVIKKEKREITEKEREFIIKTRRKEIYQKLR